MKYLYRALITGGTGTIGREIAKQILGWDVTIFSRNEKDQVAMKLEYPSFRYVVGDVRDESEVLKACKDKDYVFHFAALKHVDICQAEPQEAIKTNVLGTLNVINACQQYGCQMINMSSDKAIRPNNVYGMTKYLSEAMVNEAGYVNIRSGNVLWSSGSVLQIWKSQLMTSNEIVLTSTKMTRFFIHPTELALFILNHKDKDGGTYTVPMKSFRLHDIAREFVVKYGGVGSHIVITEPRAGERLHEFRDENISSETNICTDLSYIFQ